MLGWVPGCLVRRGVCGVKVGTGALLVVVEGEHEPPLLLPPPENGAVVLDPGEGIEVVYLESTAVVGSDGFRSDTHRYESRCHYLPHFISNSDTNTDIIEYEYTTDISNLDSFEYLLDL
jgi:hypothetical protein